MRTPLIILVIGAGLGLAAVVHFAFRNGPEVGHATTPQNRTDGEAPDHVQLSVRLGWLANANSAGQIVALDRGFYGEEGLDITFHEGGLADPSVKTVAGGVDDIGFANAPDLVINARSNGAPLKIIGVIHSVGYHAFLVRDGSDIHHPRDWVGKRVGIKAGSPTYTLYLALLRKYDIDRSTVHEVPLGYDLRPFIDGEVEVYPGATTNEQISLSLGGIPTRAILPADHGFRTMGNVVFATDAMCRNRSDALRRFMRATMRGWEWCKSPEHREEVLDCLTRFNPALDRHKESLALDAGLQLIGDGKVDQTRLQCTIDYMSAYADLSPPPRFDDMCFSIE